MFVKLYLLSRREMIIIGDLVAMGIKIVYIRIDGIVSFVA